MGGVWALFVDSDTESTHPLTPEDMLKVLVESDVLFRINPGVVQLILFV